MKKSVYFLTSVLLFSHSLQAGKYFNVSEDERGDKTVYFKKSGKQFKTAVDHLLMVATPQIHRITFHENVSREQR